MRRRPASAAVPTFVAAPVAQQPAEDLGDWPGGDELRGSSQRRAGTSRALVWLLWGLIAAALALSAVAALGAGAAPAPSQPRAATASAPPADAPPGGCAELVVTAWLAGDAAALHTLVGADVPRLPAGQRAAQRTYTVAAAPAPGPTPGWSYLIGADVLTIDKAGASKPAGVQFFAVTLARPARSAATAAAAAGTGCRGWTALTLPAQVAGLADAEPVDLDYDRTVPTAGHPLADTLTRFFAALLTGTGDLERYVAPGAAVRAIRPAPYTAVRLEHIAVDRRADVGRGEQLPADGTRVQLLVTVAARAGDQGGEWPLVYPLTAAVRGGRWEVTDLQAAPAVAAEQSTASPHGPSPATTAAGAPTRSSSPPAPAANRTP